MAFAFNPLSGKFDLVNAATTPGGSDTYVQFNDAGVFGGDAGFTYSKTTDSAALAGDLTVADEAYGSGWNGSLEVPTKNAVYDKIETISGGGVSSVSNADGTLTVSPTTGGVVASLALGHANTWSGQQTFGTAAPIFGTMTAGSVLFAGTSGLLSQDNANFFWDDASNSLQVTGATGGELVTNGTPGSASGWTLNSPWAFSGSKFAHASNGTGTVIQSVGEVGGELYAVTYTVLDWTAGTVTVSIGGVTGTARSANGTYTERFLAVSSDDLTFTPSNTARLSINGFSVKKLSGGVVRTGYASVFENHSDATPGTSRAASFYNQGTNTWLDFSFGGVLKSSIGANSAGGLRVYHTAGHAAEFHTLTSGLYAYVDTDAYHHSGNANISGYGQFGNAVGAGTGSSTTPTSTLQVAGSFAAKVKRLAASGNLDSTATHWLLDGTTSEACDGTPSTETCSSYGSDQTTCESHLPCAWQSGSSCSTFDNESGMTTCAGTSGCTVETTSCGGAGDQSSCEAQDDSYGGSCAWTEGFASCSVYDADLATCAGTSGCTPNLFDCTVFFDEGSCVADPHCSWNGVTCDGGSGIVSCSGSYSTGFSCTGTYNNGTCSGSYGTACTGTVLCSSYADSGSCAAEAGCSWVTLLLAQLPDGDTCRDRTYWLRNDASGGADAKILPFAGQTVNETTEYALAAYRDWVHLAYFELTSDCSDFNGDITSCQNHGCSWSDPDCTGGYTVSKNWYKFGS